MEYRRVGRGGAGNYYSAQDIAEAQKRTAEVSHTRYLTSMPAMD